MTNKPELTYYILFANYTQGMALRELLTSNQIPSRISPTPRSIQGPLTCGMSLLINKEDMPAVKSCIEKNMAEYYDIIELPCQIQPNRFRFC